MQRSQSFQRVTADLTPTILAIVEVCNVAKLDFKRTVECIHCYAERNKKFHSEIKQLIGAGKYTRIAKEMHAKIIEIDSVMPEGKEEEREMLRDALLEKRDAW